MEPKDVPSRSLENSSHKSYADYEGPSQEVSEDSNSGLARHHCSCDLEAEEKQNKTKQTSFCLCPKNLLEAESKSNELIYLSVEVSKEPALDSIMRLLVSMPRQVYYEKEQMTQRKTHCRREKDNGKLDVTAEAYAGREAVDVEKIRVVTESPR